LENKVNEAVLRYGPDRVGVYVVAFDEIAPIFIQSQYRAFLPTVKWYGSDGSALNNNLVRNIGSANFAFKTNFSNPIFGVENDSDENYKRVENELHKTLERVPRSYASVAYDIFWISSLTENSINKNGMQTDLGSLKKTFEKVANSYKGITGNTSLNSLGDRRYGDYDFWAIRSTNDEADGINNYDDFAWKRVGKYMYSNSTNTQGIIHMFSTG
jgi:branched-chain amino acid transport system substrate-binding protein